MNTYKLEGKSKEEVLSKCIEELNTTEEQIYFNIVEKESGLFKTKKYEIEAIEKTKILEFIKNYLKELTNKMNIDSQMEIRENEGIINIQLISENNPILIGKDGRTISAIQLLLRQTLSNNFKFNIKVNLDVSNYKNRKLKRLEYEIKKIAREVQKTKMDVSLDPMNSYERRCIHCLITEFENLETESTGEGTERHIVIKYIEK